MRCVIDVPASVTVRSAAQFSQHLLDVLEANQDVELNLLELAELDLSFVQIVYAARAQLAREDKTLRLTAPAAPHVAALLDRAGFATDPSDIEFWFQGDLPR
jgi:anti-anti-sigma regulatory factor